MPAVWHGDHLRVARRQIIVGPCDDLHSLKHAHEEAMEPVLVAADALGLIVLGCGMQPRTPASLEIMTPRPVPSPFKFFRMPRACGSDPAAAVQTPLLGAARHTRRSVALVYGDRQRPDPRGHRGAGAPDTDECRQRPQLSCGAVQPLPPAASPRHLPVLEDTAVHALSCLCCESAQVGLCGNSPLAGALPVLAWRAAALQCLRRFGAQCARDRTQRALPSSCVRARGESADTQIILDSPGLCWPRMHTGGELTGKCSTRDIGHEYDGRYGMIEGPFYSTRVRAAPTSWSFLAAIENADDLALTLFLQGGV